MHSKRSPSNSFALYMLLLLQMKINLFGIDFTLLHELLATLATFRALKATTFSFKCLS